ncbi:MAG: acyltransferase family protein [Sneathiella sp.]
MSEMISKYRRDIDGLRAVAVLSVLVYHLNHDWLSGGFVGVDIFFVISGYLITQIIVSEIAKDTFSFSVFYARRIRRIFPALFAMLFVTAFVAWFILPHQEYKSFFQDFKMAAGQISNFHFARTVEYLGVGIEASPLLHTWSLAVEEQFYLVWPLLCLTILSLAGKKWLKIVMIAGFFLSLAVCQYLLSIGETENAFYMFYARAFELIIGAILALNLFPVIKNLFYRHLISVAGGVLIALSFVVIDTTTLFPGYMALLPAVGAACLLYSGGHATPGILNRFLAFSPMVGVGLISYSLYLWHWPLIVFTQILTGQLLTPTHAVLVAVASIVAAYLSFRFIEKPFRKTAGPTKPHLKFWNASSKTVSTGILTILLTIIIGQQFRAQQQWFGRSYNNDMLTMARQTAAPTTLRCSENEELQENADVSEFVQCVFRENPEGTDVIQVGDSHSMYFKKAARAWSKSNNLTFQDFAVSGCSMLFSDYRFGSKSRPAERQTICSRLALEIADIIRQYPNRERTIFMVNRNDIALSIDKRRVIELTPPLPGTPSTIEKQLELYRRSIEHLTSLGNVKIILVGQATVLKNSPFICLDKQQIIPLYSLFSGGVDCPAALVPNEYQDQLDLFHTQLRKLTEQYANVEYFGIDQYVASLYDDKGQLLYKDNNHISELSADLLFSSLKKAFRNFPDRNATLQADR